MKKKPESLDAPPGFFVQKYDENGLMLHRSGWTIQRLPDPPAEQIPEGRGAFW